MKAQNYSFTYYDSVAGEQQKKHKILSEIIKYIEDFGYHGDSVGTVFCDGVPIMEYVSSKEKLIWIHLKGDLDVSEGLQKSNFDLGSKIKIRGKHC